MYLKACTVRTAGVDCAEQRERRRQVVQPLHVGTLVCTGSSHGVGDMQAGLAVLALC